MTLMEGSYKFWWPETALLVDSLYEMPHIEILEWEKIPHRLGVESNGEHLGARLLMKKKSHLIGDEEPKLPREIIEFCRRVKSSEEKSPIIEYLSFELEIQFTEHFKWSLYDSSI